ncbi:MAG: rhomboid family intramembrane serine protease [Calditrichaeota bacterium]|nr:MAG: rhomboid family intramembrane serine protease [Calditrichota bacterium]
MFPIQDTIPRRNPPFVTWGIIVANVLVFMYEISLPPEYLELFVRKWGVIPAIYTTGYWMLEPMVYISLFTNMFLHGGWTHIIGNMWTLWIFGDNVEDRLGKGKFLLFYILSGIAASMTHIVFNPHSTIPAIGASGAIAGVMGAYLIMFPQSRVITLVPVFFLPMFFEIPAVIYLGVWFVSQLFSGTFAILASTSGGGIAWWAHIGGFIAGIILRFILGPTPRTYRRHYPDEMIWIRDLHRL